MSRSRFTNLTAFGVSCVIGAWGVLVVWGSLGAWQIGVWVRGEAARACGTQSERDLTWAVTDRSVAGSFGPFGSTLVYPGAAPGIVVTEERVLPRVLGRGLWSAAATWTILLAGIGVCALASVALGQAAAGAFAACRYRCDLRRSGAAREQFGASLWAHARITAMCAIVGAAVVWYLSFDRTVTRVRVDHYLDIGLVPLGAMFAALLVVGVVVAALGWWRALLRATSAQGRARARRCLRCGYPRVGLGDRPCPECGANTLTGFASLPAMMGRDRAWALSVAALIVMVSVVVVAVVAARRDSGVWSVRGTKSWLALRSPEFVINRIRGWLPENVCARIRKGNDVVLVRWRSIPSVTGWVQPGEIELQSAVFDATAQSGAKVRWTTTRRVRGSTEGPPQGVVTECGSLWVRVQDSETDSGVYGELLRFEMTARPDHFDLLPYDAYHEE